MSRLEYIPELPPELVAVALEQTHHLWSGGQPLESWTESVLAELRLAGRDMLRMAGYVDSGGSLVCSLERFGIFLTCGKGVVPAIGVGSVFTPDTQRGRGLASKLVAQVMEEAKTEKRSAALLFSDIEPAFYEKLDFVAYPAQRWVCPCSTLPEADVYKVHSASAEDERWMLEHYERHLPAELVRPARTLETWRFFRRKNGSPGNDLILSRDGRRVGYLNADPSHDIFWVNEWSVEEDGLEMLWSTIRSLAVSHDADSAAGWVRHAEPPPGAIQQERPKSIPMIAALDGRFDPRAGTPHFDALDHF